MTIFGNDVSFNDIKISDYNLITVGLSDSDTTDELDIGHNMNIESNRIGLKPRMFLDYVKYDKPLELKMVLMKKDYSPIDVSLIRELNTLFTVDEYVKLIIDEQDYSDMYFNVITSNIEYNIISGKYYAIILTLECDNSYGYKHVEAEYDQLEQGGTHTYTLYAESDDTLNNKKIGIRPTISVYADSDTVFTIINNKTNDSMSFSTIYANETLTINTEYKILSSTISNHNYYNLFNKKWFKLYPNSTQTITITGNVKVKISYESARKVGVPV